MKIALVILHANPAKGGAERYTLDLAAALAQRGHQVTLVATTFAQVPAGIAAQTIVAGGLTRLGRYEAFLDALDAHLASVRYDIVHAMLPVRRCDLYHPHAGIAAEVLASPRWSDRLNLKRRRFGEIERGLLSREDGPIVLCLSKYVREQLLKHYAIREKRLEILFNGVDLEKFTPADPPVHPGINALMIAQDFERKGLAQAIKALAQVPDPRLRLTVVGRPDPARYQRLAQSLGVADRVLFPGPTPNPRQAYAAADFFILPTRHDPCSLVVLEALAMGLPVITTRQNGASEIMTDGVHGFVLNSFDDLGGLADAFRQLSDPQTRFAMVSSCLGLRQVLSHGAHIESLERIYARVLAARDGDPHSGHRSGEARRS
jgi:UDP-glucose:(heptosyl)LPS alpha-1,3-glucosyltransferase